MRATTRILTTFGLLLATAVGCDKFSADRHATDTPSNENNVAVIDLDSIAQQLGYDIQMDSAIQQQKASLEKQLGVIKTSFEQDLAKAKDQIGANPTQEQSQQFAHSQRAAVVRLTQEQKKASNLLNHYRAQLIGQFRSTVKVTARQVAAERHLSVILTKNDSVVFDYDMAIDITDAVVERMRADQQTALPRAEAQGTREPSPPPSADNPAPEYGRS